MWRIQESQGAVWRECSFSRVASKSMEQPSEMELCVCSGLDAFAVLWLTFHVDLSIPMPVVHQAFF
jgi:hypothetical protein